MYSWYLPDKSFFAHFGQFSKHLSDFKRSCLIEMTTENQNQYMEILVSTLVIQKSFIVTNLSFIVYFTLGQTRVLLSGSPGIRSMDQAHHQCRGGTTTSLDVGVQYEGGTPSVWTWMYSHVISTDKSVQHRTNKTAQEIVGGCIYLRESSFTDTLTIT